MNDLVLSWNSMWRYDFWYRQRYNIAFNSEAHRALSQIDIKFDYLEKKLAEQQREKYEQQQKELEQYNKTGQWLKDSKIDKKQEDELFKHITIKNLS